VQLLCHHHLQRHSGASQARICSLNADTMQTRMPSVTSLHMFASLAYADVHPSPGVFGPVAHRLSNLRHWSSAAMLQGPRPASVQCQAQGTTGLQATAASSPAVRGPPLRRWLNRPDPAVKPCYAAEPMLIPTKHVWGSLTQRRSTSRPAQ